MATIIGKTRVQGITDVDELQVKRTKRRFIFFTVEWWETVQTDRVGNKIFINTQNEINTIVLNGREIDIK